MSQEQAYYFRANMITMFVSTLIAILIAVPAAMFVASRVMGAEIAKAATFAPQTVQPTPVVYASAPVGSTCTDTTTASAGAVGSSFAGYLVSGAVAQTQSETNTTTNNNYSYVNSYNRGSYNTDNSVDTSVVTTTVLDNSQTNSNNNIGNTNNSNNTTQTSTIVNDNSSSVVNETDIEDSFGVLVINGGLAASTQL